MESVGFPSDRKLAFPQRNRASRRSELRLHGTHVRPGDGSELESIPGRVEFGRNQSMIVSLKRQQPVVAQDVVVGPDRAQNYVLFRLDQRLPGSQDSFFRRFYGKPLAAPVGQKQIHCQTQRPRKGIAALRRCAVNDSALRGRDQIDCRPQHRHGLRNGFIAYAKQRARRFENAAVAIGDCQRLGQRLPDSRNC